MSCPFGWLFICGWVSLCRCQATLYGPLVQSNPDLHFALLHLAGLLVGDDFTELIECRCVHLGFIGTQPYQLRSRAQTVGNITILQGPGECVPCRKAGCEDRSESKSDCLVNLPVIDVINAAKSYGINCS